jgi:tetratricopeptide (TPR) repeat protein
MNSVAEGRMKYGLLLGLTALLVAAVIAALITLVPSQTMVPIRSPEEHAAGSRQMRVTETQQRREPILIPGVQEPDEMRVEPLLTKTVELTDPERELAEATRNFSKVNLAELLPALDRILAKYPDFADGYVFRLGAFCERNDWRAAMSDINNALKFMSSSRSMAAKEPPVDLLSMRAKPAYADGDYLGAMEGLDKAIRADLKNANRFTNSAAAKPEKTASVCVWAESDMDALVQRFPIDYRSHMFRGLYFSFFVNFNPEDWIITRAMESFSKAAQLNPKSALPQLFKARLLSHFFVFNTRLNQLGWGDADRDKLNAELVAEYAKVLVFDPNLLLALEGRANAYFNLKQYQQAIADYERILSLDPQDRGAYHDRGLANMQLGRNYDAISDFSSAIKLQPRTLGGNTTAMRAGPMPT